MDSPNVNQTSDVLDALLQPSGKPENFILTLAQFKELYQDIHRQRGETKVDIVLNGEWALVQFGELCNHRIRVLPNGLYRRITKALNWHLYLEKNDFEIAFSSAEFYGQLEYLNWWRFTKEEARVNGVKGVVIFLLSGFFLSVAVKTSTNVISSVNDILIGVSAIFFSIFVLFTISLNLPLVDMYSFRQGLTHRFVQVDKKVAYLAVFALTVASFNRVFADTQVLQIPQTSLWTQNTVDMQRFLSWSTAFGISIMAISLLTVIQYYFRRVQNLYEKDFSKRILDEAFTDRNHQID